MSNKSRQTELFKYWCPPGSEPIEAWIERLLATPKLSTTARAIGLVMAHRFTKDGKRTIGMDKGEWKLIASGAGMNPLTDTSRKRSCDAINALHRNGLVKLVLCRCDTCATEKMHTLLSIELLITKEVRS